MKEFRTCFCFSKLIQLILIWCEELCNIKRVALTSNKYNIVVIRVIYLLHVCIIIYTQYIEILPYFFILYFYEYDIDISILSCIFLQFSFFN